MEFNEIIKMLRDEHGLTQQQVAERLCISAQAVSKWENGSSMPDVSAIPNIAKLYDVSTDYLFGLTNEIQEDPLKYYNQKLNEAFESEETELAVDIIESIIKRFPKNYTLKFNLIHNLLNIRDYNMDLSNLYEEKRSHMWTEATIKDYEETMDEKFTLDPGDSIVTEEEYDEITDKMRKYSENNIYDRIDNILTNITADIVYNSGDRTLTMMCLKAFIDLCNKTNQQDKAEKIISEAAPIKLSREVLTAALDRSAESCKTAIFEELSLIFEQHINMRKQESIPDNLTKEMVNDMIRTEKKMLSVLSAFFEEDEYGSFRSYYVSILSRLTLLYTVINSSDEAKEYYQLLETAIKETTDYDEKELFTGGYFMGMPLGTPKICNPKEAANIALLENKIPPISIRDMSLESSKTYLKYYQLYDKYITNK